jgi:hypothetical protein
MKPHKFILSLITILFCGSAYSQPTDSGAIIVLNASGLVEAISPDGKKVPGLVKRGSVLTEGFTIKTGAFAESVLLFSNGTVATLSEKTTLRISIFSQQPFDAGNLNFENMAREPSQSYLSLSLVNGSLVVKTKKLNDLSTFNIKTGEGVIRVHGTEFQLGYTPGEGLKLDVLESTVSFLPKGAGKPVQVSSGNGLDASRGGAKSRPISPVAAQKISTKNRFATIVSATVPLSTIKQAAVKAQAVAGRIHETADVQAYEEEYEEEEEDRKNSKAEKALLDLKKSTPSFKIEEAQDFLEVVKGLTSRQFAKSFKFGEKLNEDGSVSILFYLSDYKKAEDPESLSPFETLTFTKEDFANLKPEDLQSTFATIYGNNDQEIDALGVYVYLGDYFEDTTSVDYNDLYNNMNEALSLAYKILLEDRTYTTSGSFNILEGDVLYNDFINSGHGKQASRIIGHYASSGSRDSILQISEDVFSAFQGNGSTPATSVAFGIAKSSDTVSLNTDQISGHTTRERESLNREIYKTDLSNLGVVSGRDITLGVKGSSSTFDLSSTLKSSDPSAANRKSLAITATDDLHLNGDITFKNSNAKNPGHDVLLLGAADHIEGMQYNSAGNKQKITNEGTHLVMGSYSHLTAKYVDIKTGGNLAIGALEDLNLDTVSFDAGRANKNDNITLYSDTTLNLTNPSFDGNAREIYMQGQTINLRDVSFNNTNSYLFRSKTAEFNFDKSNSAPDVVNFLGTNYWGTGNDKFEIKDTDFYKLPSGLGNDQDGHKIEGWNSKFNTKGTDTPGIRIRKIQ